MKQSGIGFLACVVAMAVGTGCGPDVRTGEDAGITLMDTGSPMGMRDGGGPGDDCPAMTAPPPEPDMVCAAETLQCLMQAMSEADAEACFAAEPNREACEGCLQEDAFFACTSPGGGNCGDQYGEVICCLQEECGSASMAEQMACINSAFTGACSAQAGAFDACAMGNQGCAPTTACFMQGSGVRADQRAFPRYPGAEVQSLDSIRAAAYQHFFLR